MRTIILLAVFILPLTCLAVEDSIGVEVVDGKTYILHRIEQGETLFRISVNYSTSVANILAANPGLEGAVYKAGQIIRVPSRSAPPAVVQGPADTKKSDKQAAVAASGPANHKVQAGETLFAVSKQYGLTVKELMRLNGMENTDIREGQVLKVRVPEKNGGSQTAVSSDIPKDSLPVLTASSDPSWSTETANPTSLSYPDQYKRAMIGGSYVELHANGAVTWVPELTPQSSGYYALHKTVPVGSMIKVKNPINGRIVYAKVVGTLPQSTNGTNVVLKLPSSAKQQLKIFDEVMFVEISYLVPRE